jgi:DNA ligase 1
MLTKILFQKLNTCLKSARFYSDVENPIKFSASEANLTDKSFIEDKNAPFDNYLKTGVINPLISKEISSFPRMKFSLLASTLEKVAIAKGKDSKNIQKTILCNFFRLIMLFHPQILTKSFCLAIGKLYPDYKETELGVGKETIYKIISKICDKEIASIKDLENKIGDVSLIFENLMSNEMPFMSNGPSLSIDEVYDSLYKVSSIHGTNSNMLKESEIISLLKKASSVESKYIIRIIQKSLKIGASEITVLSALARAGMFKKDSIIPDKNDPKAKKKSLSASEFKVIEEILQKVSALCPDYNQIISALMSIQNDKIEDPIKSLEQALKSCGITLGAPVKLMTAQPAKGYKEITSRFKDLKISCEFKYDGIRAQIHVFPDKSIQIYTRGNENITERYPDIENLFFEGVNFANVHNCILDCELVAYDRVNKKIEKFQQIQQRRAKKVDIEEIKIQVCVFVFDVIYFNGQSLIEKKLEERRSIFFKNIPQVPEKLQFVEFKNVENFEEIESFLLESVEKDCEGLMIKPLIENSNYKPGVRSFNWIKLKKDYISDLNGDSMLADSLDVVPIGAYYGNGKRVGLYGSFLLAIYDSSNDEYQTISKMGTGFSDVILKQMHDDLQPHVIKEPLSSYKTFIKPDVWFEPSLVWEIKAADLSESLNHTAAWSQIIQNKGVSLRFPRYVRSRPDKKPHDCTSSSQVVSMVKNK